jgi:aryl carrier-like protein
MAYDAWQGAMAPKVQGAWNIHEVLEETQVPLDFLLLISSVSGLYGQYGQANYAAANTFLDAFSQYRQAQGLPCAIIDLGVVDDIGYVSRNPRILSHFHTLSTHVLHESDVLESLQVLIARSIRKPAGSGADGKQAAASDVAPPGQYEFVNKFQLGVGFRSTQPLAAPNNRTIWKRDLAMAMYYNIENQDTLGSGAGSGGNQAIKQFLMAAASDPSLLSNDEAAEFLATQIGLTLCAFMLRTEESLDISLPLSAFGLDSLVAVELRNWFRQTFGFEISVMQVMEAPSLIALGRQTADRIMQKHVAPEEASVPVIAGEEWPEHRQAMVP